MAALYRLALPRMAVPAAIRGSTMVWTPAVAHGVMWHTRVAGFATHPHPARGHAHLVPADTPASDAAQIELRSGQFVVAVPWQGSKLEFRLNQNAAGSALESALCEETGEAVQFVPAKGDAESDDNLSEQPLSELVLSKVALRVGKDRVPLQLVSKHAVAGRTLHLPSLMHQSLLIKLRRLIESDSRRSMPFAEFKALCTKNGLTDEEAIQFCEQLNSIGVVLHFGHSPNPDVRDTVFLKPEEVVDAVFNEYGLVSPTKALVQAEAATKRQELEQAELQLSAMQTTKNVLDGRAEVSGQRMAWGGLAALMAGGGTYWWLTYIQFSWDIMEPITYFTGAFFGICGFIWWHNAAEEFGYRNMRAVVVRRARRRLYEQEGFDEKRYDELVGTVERVKQELATLDMTAYNPALIAAYTARAETAPKK